MIAAVALVAVAVLLSVILGSSGSKHSSSRAATATAAGGEHSDAAIAAAYLGVSAAQLRGELHSGRTLAQIASSTPGRSAAGLEEAITRARGAALAAAASSGKISSAQEQTLLAGLNGRTAAQISRRRLRGRATAAAPLTAAYLGLPLERVRREQGEGRSLAQIADATPGHSASGLTARILAADRSRIEAEAAAGTITPAVEHQLLANAEYRVTVRVHEVPKTAAKH